MSRQGFDPKTGETFRRLQMCSACLDGFHLSCTDPECSCRRINHISNSARVVAFDPVLKIVTYGTQRFPRSV